MQIHYKKHLEATAENNKLTLVTLSLDDKYAPDPVPGGFHMQFGLRPAQARELQSVAVKMLLDAHGIGLTREQQTYEERFEHAKELLLSALGRFEASERSPASDRLAWEIKDFLDND